MFLTWAFHCLPRLLVFFWILTPPASTYDLGVESRSAESIESLEHNRTPPDPYVLAPDLDDHLLKVL